MAEWLRRLTCNAFPVWGRRFEPFSFSSCITCKVQITLQSPINKNSCLKKTKKRAMFSKKFISSTTRWLPWGYPGRALIEEGWAKSALIFNTASIPNLSASENIEGYGQANPSSGAWQCEGVPWTAASYFFLLYFFLFNFVCRMWLLGWLFNGSRRLSQTTTCELSQCHWEVERQEVCRQNRLRDSYQVVSNLRAKCLTICTDRWGVHKL